MTCLQDFQICSILEVDLVPCLKSLNFEGVFVGTFFSSECHRKEVRQHGVCRQMAWHLREWAPSIHGSWMKFRKIRSKGEDRVFARFIQFIRPFLGAGYTNITGLKALAMI